MSFRFGGEFSGFHTSMDSILSCLLHFRRELISNTHLPQQRNSERVDMHWTVKEDYFSAYISNRIIKSFCSQCPIIEL